ncbi:MAG: lysine--tRNA ligase, partial [Altibacter sp.]|nr:lysine--tRNA ligase [Altibacter sp.]
MDRLVMFLTNNASIQEVLFFPQMRPERRIAADIALTQEEKDLFEILKKNSPISLEDLKTQSGLSNKKWDKTIKHLTKSKLAKVEKTADGLMVEVI